MQRRSAIPRECQCSILPSPGGEWFGLWNQQRSSADASVRVTCFSSSLLLFSVDALEICVANVWGHTQSKSETPFNDHAVATMLPGPGRSAVTPSWLKQNLTKLRFLGGNGFALSCYFYRLLIRFFLFSFADIVVQTDFQI